jgi:DNA repair protein RadA/Sms
MSKVKSAFFCQNCGHQAPKWLGKCPACQSWNTLVEEVLKKENTPLAQVALQAKVLQDIALCALERKILKDKELNRVLGGGVVDGSLMLLGGEPGIGKSTLLLQMLLENNQYSALYVSGEESAEQIKMRADRLGLKNDKVWILAETNTEQIIAQAHSLQADFLVIDSVQTLQSPSIDAPSGSVSQIRTATAEIMDYAKKHHVPVFLVGHITKEGTLAGPKLLEHIVDVVLQFEGDRNHLYRVLRVQKNRFGSTQEIGIYEMQGTGLRPIDNPSELLVNQYDTGLSGVAIASTIEGARPLLVEVQALVSSSVYGTPQRSCTGFDVRRLNMLLAVLEKRCQFKLAQKDVFVNIAGGIRVDDPAIDLAVVSAILSSNMDIALAKHLCFAAEIGLTGEIRPIPRLENRIAQAQQLGYEQIVVSSHHALDTKKYQIEIVALSKIGDLFSFLFA